MYVGKKNLGESTGVNMIVLTCAFFFLIRVAYERLSEAPPSPPRKKRHLQEYAVVFLGQGKHMIIRAESQEQQLQNR